MMFILFFVSGLLSLFAKEIKEFFSYWPGRALNTSTRNGLVRRLQVLDNLHQNPYGLLVYFGMTFVDIVFTVAIGTASLILILGGTFQIKISNVEVLPIALGIFASKVHMFGAVLKDLCNYEKVTGELRTILDSVNQDLARIEQKRIQKESTKA